MKTCVYISIHKILSINQRNILHKFWSKTSWFQAAELTGCNIENYSPIMVEEVRARGSVLGSKYINNLMNLV